MNVYCLLIREDFIYLNTFHSKFAGYEVFIVWQSSSAECKSEHNSYLFGDIDLTDPSKACKSIQGMVPSPSWIGIAKEKYISIDGGKFRYKILLISDFTIFTQGIIIIAEKQYDFFLIVVTM